MDSDSYVKWGASLAGQLPEAWEPRLVVLEAQGSPSDRQVAEALTRTDFSLDDVERLGARSLRHAIETWAPDVLLLATRAHAVPHLVEWIERQPRRPVVVTGVAGIALPVQWYDVNLRRGADLFVTHSRREVEEIAAVAARHDVRHRTTLATLPFLAHVRTSAVPSGEPTPGTSIVFAPQSLVPASAQDRRRLLERLADAARAHPERRVVVKLRAQAGESEAHRGGAGYVDLAHDLDLPSNLVFADGPMAEHLEDAAALVTVSSSAVLEAMAADVPALVLTDFGIDDAHMNSLFVGSRLLGTTDDVVAGRFHRADPEWAADNYFHDADDDTWVADVEELLARREDGLDEPARIPRTFGNRLRGVYYRHNALQPWRGTPLAPLERLMLWAAHVANRRVLHLR